MWRPSITRVQVHRGDAGGRTVSITEGTEVLATMNLSSEAAAWLASLLRDTGGVPSGPAPHEPPAGARLPPVYVDARWRCVTPVCPARGSLGVAFDVPGQPPVRLALPVDDARALMGLLSDYVNSPAGTQSPMSELMPSAERSVPSEGV